MLEEFIRNPTSYVLKETVNLLNGGDNSETRTINNRIEGAIDSYKAREFFHASKMSSERCRDMSYLPFIVGLIAAYLSWNCNTAKGYTFVEKVIFSFFAYIFGGIYILYYFLVRYDECKIK